MQDFRDNLLVPNNAFLILVGKLPARADLLGTIMNEFGAWEQKAVPAYAAPKPRESKRQLVLIDRPGSVQADMRLGRIAATYNDPLYFPENVGSIVEGGGPSSRLFLDIREKRGYAYDVHTEISALADAGTFSTVTQVRNEVAAEALQGILEHLDRMAKEPVEKQELIDAKSYANGVFLLGMEPQRGLADRLAQIKIMNLPKNYLETYTTRINSVEPDQIEAAAKKYMAPDNDVIVVVGDASKIQKPLEKIGTVPGHTARSRETKSMKITSSKEVYSCSLFRVTEDEAEDRTGWKMKRSIVRHRGSAVMMAVDEKNRVMLVRQYRLPANQFLWELPAGKTDEGETVLQAARRELIEETGLRAKKWKKLVSFFPSPGYVEEKMTIFLATDLTAGRIAADGRRTDRDALVHEEGTCAS